MVSRRLLGLLAALAVPVRALTGSKPKYQHEHRHEHARRPVNTSGRPVGSSASSFLQTDADADSAAMVSMTTLSKEEWHAQHKAMYETEFTIELDMTAAHDGTPIGVELWSPKNNQPLAVKSVAEVGLVQSWNAAHPDRAVRAGDEVIKINDVKWQNHNRMFIQHLQKVFGFLKEQRPGMQKVLELGFQRPKRWRTPLDSAKSESLR